MVLMEIVICLHALVSVGHSDLAVATYMVRLRGTRARNPQITFSCCFQNSGVGGLEP